MNNIFHSFFPLFHVQLVGNADEYSKKIKEYSIVNQLKYKDNLSTALAFCLEHLGTNLSFYQLIVSVRYVEKSQRVYYDQLLKYSREHYMLFPYHLSNYIVSHAWSEKC